MNSEIRVERVQADKCRCGKGTIESYQVVGPDILSPRRYDKDAAEALASAYREIESWKKTAAEFSRNVDFYRGIVTGIGAQFGIEARTSDDGSIQQDVLCLKVPELVAKLRVKLRDEFAMAALSGLLACFRDHGAAETPPTRALLAWRYADEMIKARSPK